MTFEVIGAGVGFGLGTRLHALRSTSRGLGTRLRFVLLQAEVTVFP